MNRHPSVDRTDYDALRGFASAGRVEEPAAEEPSKRQRAPGKGGDVRLLDRIVMGAAYAVQWVRSKWSSRHEGRS